MAASNLSSMLHTHITAGNSNGRTGIGGEQHQNPSLGSAPVNSAVRRPQLRLGHNPGLSVEWTAEEQAQLEDLHTRFASYSPMDRYARISKILRVKTIRDVALRCRFLSIISEKKRKDSTNSSRKNGDQKGKAVDSSSIQPIGNSDGLLTEVLNGPSGWMLKQNSLIMDLISTNLEACKLRENINLLRIARANIHKIMSKLNDEAEGMQKMPSFPYKLEEELANSILGAP